MEAYYLEIRAVHVWAVLAEGALFLLRALAFNGFGAQWPLHGALRSVRYTIDTVFLTAAFMLMTVVHEYPFVHAWLTVKVLLFIAYFWLTAIALTLHRPRGVRIAASAGAILVFGFIVSVARARDPLGVLISGRVW